MTTDTDTLREALEKHYPEGMWKQPCGNTVLVCECGENLWGVNRGACQAAWRLHVEQALATLSKPEPAAVDGNDTPPSLNAPTFNDRAEERVCINGCLFLRADFAARRYTSPVPSGGASTGDYEARYVAGGVPTDCVDYGVVRLSAGKEVCRVWHRDDAEMIARLLNASPYASPSSEAIPAEQVAQMIQDAIATTEQRVRMEFAPSEAISPPDAREEFNINEPVRVKLTEKGMDILRRDAEDLRAQYPSLSPWTPPAVDEEGYSEFQLWTLMRSFGEYIIMGCELPFETTIILKSRQAPDARAVVLDEAAKVAINLKCSIHFSEAEKSDAYQHAEKIARWIKEDNFAVLQSGASK